MHKFWLVVTVSMSILYKHIIVILDSIQFFRKKKYKQIERLIALHAVFSICKNGQIAVILITIVE